VGMGWCWDWCLPKKQKNTHTHTLSLSLSLTHTHKLPKKQTSGADEYVLDLRGNPGGSVQAAVEVASVFLDGEKVGVCDVCVCEWVCLKYEYEYEKARD
jgi:hypothetical protein